MPPPLKNLFLNGFPSDEGGLTMSPVWRNAHGGRDGWPGYLHQESSQELHGMVIDTTICHQNHHLAEQFNITSFSIVIKPYVHIAMHWPWHQLPPISSAIRICQEPYIQGKVFMLCKYFPSLSSTRASWRQLKMQPKNEEICVEINSQVSHHQEYDHVTQLKWWLSWNKPWLSKIRTLVVTKHSVDFSFLYDLSRTNFINLLSWHV